MKKILLALISLCAVFGAKAQVAEVWKGGVKEAYVEGADSICLTNNVVSSAAAMAWANEHADSLVNVVWGWMQNSTTPNTLDPDLTREVFRSQGYDGRNVGTFLAAGRSLNTALTDSLIKRARAAGNNKIVVVAGNSGAGKSTAVKSFPEVKSVVTDAGIVFDALWSNSTKLATLLKNMREQGFTDQTVILVYNDAETSFNNACNRFLATGRVISLEFFLSDNVYPCYQGYVSDFLEKEVKDMGVKRIYLSNAQNVPTLVTAEEASKWDYSISDELKHKMAWNLYEYIKAHKDQLSYRDAWSMYYNYE